MRGSTKCRMHGGTNKGPAPVHGKYSKHLPTRLAARYEEALKDKDLTSVRHEISLTEAMLSETLEAMRPDSEAEMWKSAVDKYSWLKVIGKDEPTVQVNGLVLSALGDILRNGLGEAQKKREALGLMENKRKLAETEAKRIQSLQMTLTVEQAVNLGMQITRIVNERIDKHIHDTATKSRLRSEIGSAIGELYRTPDSPVTGGVGAN